VTRSNPITGKIHRLAGSATGRWRRVSWPA